MTDTLKIDRIWISRRCRYNSEKREQEHYYECDFMFGKNERVSIEIQLDEEYTQKIFKTISPLLKRELLETEESIPDEL